MLNRTVRNRTRQWKEPKVGDLCFFYRENRKTKDKGVVSGWIGPACVVGLQGNGSVWLTMGGRCYLVAMEMRREAIGEEEYFGRPEVQQAVSMFKNYRKGITYHDLRDQKIPEEHTLDEPPGMDDGDGNDNATEQDVPMFEATVDMSMRAKQLSKWAQRQGWHYEDNGDPVKVIYNAWGFQTPHQLGNTDSIGVRSSWVWRNREWELLEDHVNWKNMDDPHKNFSDGKVSVSVTIFHKRTRTSEQVVCEDSLPSCLKKPRHMGTEVFVATKDVDKDGRGKPSKKALKALDKEIPYRDIPPEHADLYLEAKKKEWDSWLKFKSVDVLSKTESERIMREQRDRVLGSRFVYRNKHAGLTQGGVPLPVKAKARLCVAGQFSPDVLSGEVQVDAPTIQRTSFFLVALHSILGLDKELACR